MKNKFLLFPIILIFSLNLKASENQYNLLLNNANKLSIVSKSNGSLKILWQGLILAKSNKNEKYIGEFSLAIANEYLYVNQIDSIDYYYNQAKIIFEKLKLKNQLLRANLGLLELPRRTNPSSTMDQYIKLLKECRELGDLGAYYLVLEKIVMVNNGMENYKEAFSQSHECINYYKSIKDTFNLAIKYREIGSLYFTHFTGRSGPAFERDSCIYYLLKAIELSSKINAVRNTVFAYQRLSWLMSYSDLNAALKYGLVADSLDKLNNIQSPQLPNILSITLFKLGKTKEAIAKSRKALELGLKAKQLFIGIQASDQLCIYYKAEKKYDSALYFIEMSQMFNDSIRSQKQYKDAVKMQAKLESDKESYEKELIQKEEIKRQNLINRFTLGVIILLLIIIIIFYISIKNNKKKTAIIKAQNDEKTILIKEIHHRVKNNLSVISGILDLQKRNISDEQMLSIFKDAKARINSMALVHKSLYEQDDFAVINLQSYFVNLYNTVSSAYKLHNKNIESEITCENVNINIDTLIPLALITNELLTNSFKYAFEFKDSGKILIQLKNSKNGFEMIYNDNGVGLNKQQLTKEKEGLGTLLINGLIKQLDGTVKINHLTQGLEYVFLFNGIHT